MSPIFYSLKNRGKLASQKIIVTGTITFTCLSDLLTLISQTKSNKLLLYSVI